MNSAAAILLTAFTLFGAAVRAQDPAPTPATATKPKAPVYDEAADGKQQVAAALAKAKKDNQRVLIQWGANWCGWCVWLAGTMKSDEAVRGKLSAEYQVVHVDVGKFDKHKELAKELGAEIKSIPYLTILDADGKPIAQSPTEPFENEVAGKKGHDAKKLLEFLTQHQVKAVDAQSVLAAGLAAAGSEQKRVFLHFGAPSCVWCHRLEDWMAQPEIAAILGKDFVDVKIDVDRMTGGKAIHEAQLQGAGQKGDGIPWFVLLDADGKLLAHSTGPKGNCGFPYEPAEVDHFANMLRAAKVNLTDADIAVLTKSLGEIRERDEAKKKAREGAPPPPAQQTPPPPAKTGPI